MCRESSSRCDFLVLTKRIAQPLGTRLAEDQLETHARTHSSIAAD